MKEFDGGIGGGCQNCAPFLGTPNIRCRIIIGTQKGTIILTTTYIGRIRFGPGGASGALRDHRGGKYGEYREATGRPPQGLHNDILRNFQMP